MKKIILSTLAMASILSITSCNTEFETDVKDYQITAGEADFSTFVSLGNSLTAGYRDGALYLDGQNESYPNIIAEQMKKAGGGAFTQPLMPNNTGGFTNLGLPGKLTLQLISGKLTPVPSAPAGPLDFVSGSYNNLGVPGAKTFHLLANGYGNPSGIANGTANPYFARFASAANTSVLADAVKKNPTFYSLWIGNNDVLFYATSGGIGVNRTGDMNPAGYGKNDITDPTVFAGTIRTIIQTMNTAGAKKGVIANIPNVTAIPFFTAIPYNAVPLKDTEPAALNTSLLSSLKNALTALGHGDRIQLATTGKNPLLIKDESLTNLSAQLTAALIAAGVNANLAGIMGLTYGQARHATHEDLVLLTTGAVINTPPTGLPIPNMKYGISYPLEDMHILTKTEVQEVLTATATYNHSIQQLAEQFGLAFVDANAKMEELGKNSGILYNGTSYNASFVTGGAFSLDGVHLTGRGYAIIANEFIKAINKKYNATLQQVNPNHYSGITFP